MKNKPKKQQEKIQVHTQVNNKTLWLDIYFPKVN